MEGAFKGFKSAECIMAGVHDYMCYEKRGFARATMHPVTDKFDGIGLNELLKAIHHNVALKQRNAHGILVNQGLDV